MRSECKQVPLEVLCSYGTDKVLASELTAKNYISTENMLPGKGGVQEAASLPAVEKACSYRQGDVLVSNIRPYFKKIWKAAHDGGCSNDVLVFRAAAGVDASFLYYVLANDAFFAYATKSSKGTKMPRGDKDAIMNYPVVLLPLPTQRKIAAILSSLDAKIENNNAICRNLEEHMMGMFINMYTLSPRCTEGTIRDIGDVVGGGTPSKAVSEYYSASGEGVAWITPKDLSNLQGIFVSHGATDISEYGLKKSGATPMPAGAVLFSSRAPIGYVAIAANPVTTNQGFKSVVPHPYIGPAFVYCFLKQNIKLIESVASGSTFLEVSATAMKNVPVRIPEQALVEKFAQDMQPFLDEIQVLESQNLRLATLRDTLLPKLMNGKIDVN